MSSKLFFFLSPYTNKAFRDRSVFRSGIGCIHTHRKCIAWPLHKGQSADLHSALGAERNIVLQGKS